MPNNPLLEISSLPKFSAIKAEHVVPAIDHILEKSKSKIENLVGHCPEPNWENFIQPLDDIHDTLNRVWSPVSHLNSVVNSPALREAHDSCLSMLTEFRTELSQDKRIYNAYKYIKSHEDFNNLDTAQQKAINDALRDFHLSGIDLPEQDQKRFKEIRQRLSKLTADFSNNVLDATNNWYRQITDSQQLSGLPESALSIAAQTAKQRDLEGWVFTLDFSSYLAVMTYADNRALREQMHEAFVTRASDQGPDAGKWDNSSVMSEILSLRHELARLLGYGNYTEYSLATKMAESSDEVMQFLNDLAQRSKPYAQRELDELNNFAIQQHQINKLEPWDIAYYSEKLRQHQFEITQEELKPYFPDNIVLQGMFDIVKRLYGLTIREISDADTWHADVRFFEIVDDQDALRGQFFLDPYARQNKRGGAWMDECVCRKKFNGQIQIPVAYLVCNFSPPVGNNPSLLTHNEVTTLFHEFGHGLHHMMTKIDYISVSGINGVPWDAVELPSQFMENWCWERESIDLIAKHYQSGEKLPGSLFEKMIKAKNFQSGMQMVRQLEFALFDFRLHLEYDPRSGGRIQEILDAVRQDVSVVTPASYNRFQHSFTHIFAGGYAAGYYSYKWAEVLSADAFEKFEETGIFNQVTGKAFLNIILEQGGSKQPMELFKQFRGREPSINALLRHSGIAG